ncbi:uncharacterized protein LOC144092919 [Stigmatopora argus]
MMDESSSEQPGPSLTFPTLRFLVPPIRLVSAAIWQTIDHKLVSDYGMLEEFVFTITEVVPQLLSARQRAELILGLRARLILELFRSEETANIETIQPHIDRMQNLQVLWKVEPTHVTENEEPDISESHFMILVRNLLISSEERKNFFQDVFPGDFGPTYDNAIKTLMWLFLSRLEKLFPSQSLQQIASLLSDSSTVLRDCMESFTHSEGLKTALDTHKDLSQLDDVEPCDVDTAILSALCLPPGEREVVVNEQAGTNTESVVVYSDCTEMEVDSGNKMAFSNAIEEKPWLGIDDEKADADTGAASESTAVDNCEVQHHDNLSETLMIGEDGKVTVLDSLVKTPNRRGRKKKRLDDEDFQMPARAGDPDFELLKRPVRKNRGLKMKRLLSQWRKSGRTPATGSTDGSQKTFCSSPDSDKGNDLDSRTCNVCGKVVSHVKFLERHMSQHSEELTYSCEACQRSFKNVRFLHQHKCQNETEALKDDTEAVGDEDDKSPIHISEPGNEAGSADSTANDPDYLPAGEKKAVKELGQKSPDDAKSILEGPFYCPHCSVEFKCKQTFRFHLRNICYNEQQVDPDQPEDIRHCFRCNECDKAFKYKSTLDSHKQTHNPLYCEVCMKLVRDSEALAMHKESHTPFQCNQCEDNFPVFKALHKHYIDVHNPTEPFTCTYCQTTFASLKRFIRHEWKHTGYQPFQCPHCKKRFRSYSDLVEHQKKHTKAYPFLCWECGKKFRHGITLTRHVERVHQAGDLQSEKALPSFNCNQCGKSFTSRRCLLKHDNFHHKGMRFPCEHCGKGFFGKDALVRHTLIHTGERPFKCDDCDKSFRSSAELKIHRRYHTGERPFKCGICEKGFVQSCFLTLHMRTHTGERPYVCAVCNKAFSSLHGLKRHRRLVHA